MKIDTKKPVQFTGLEAKIVHVFENGNLVVVVEGRSKVFQFTPEGIDIDWPNGAKLQNKPVETSEVLVLYPQTGKQFNQPGPVQSNIPVETSSFRFA